MIGRSLGHYDVVAKLGEGGMGEVYRARDTKLSRDVALKILPDAFAADPDRLARFRREAQVLASLNHPNIAQIHGFEEHAPLDAARGAVSESRTALVMELVEGPTLADRIAHGPIAPADALPIAKQIADALEAAHEQGIIHRDLKPANVKVRDDGTVKVLDFGLAKAMEGDGSRSRDQTPSPYLANSPTMLSPAMTNVGLILGTAAYMSPEQAKGRVVDKRADIWAFGVVLYEMLTARPLFQGDSAAETIGFVATRDPDWTALPASIPASVRRLLTRCLTRDPKHRLRDIGEARIALGSADDDPSTGLRASGAPSQRERTIWIGAAVLLAVVTAAATWWFKPTPPAAPNIVTRFNQPLPAGQRFTNTGRHSIAISPDGSKIAYIANGQIYLRGMDQLEAQPIRGTNESPYEVMFSPDGHSIAYFARAGAAARTPGVTLKKVALAGGAPVALCTVDGIPFGASWRGSTITFAPGTNINAVQTVADSGGTPRSIVSLDPDKEIVLQAHLLDDGARVLMSVIARGSTPQDGGDIVVQSIDTGARTVLVRGGDDPRLLSTGHLLFVKNATLFAMAIDTRKMEPAGAAMAIVEGVNQNRAGAVAQFAISDNGTLAFAPGVPDVSPRRTLVWVDRHGKEEPLSARPRAYHHLRLSPDGKQVAVEIRDEEHDIWIWDLAREALTRLTFGSTSEGYPVWTPDGRHIFYRSDDASGTTIFRKAADGTGTALKLTHSPEDASPQSTSKDGKLLVYRGATDKTARDLMLLPLDPPGMVKPLIQTEFTEDNGQVSPDGRWIAYESQDSGQRDVFVRPFPAVDTAKVPVSSGGGSFVKWSRDGRELFYVGRVNGTQTLVVAAVPVLAAGAKFTSAKAQPLFPWANYLIGATQTYDIALDGRRILMIKEAVEVEPPPSITIVTHWFDELRARVKGK